MSAPDKFQRKKFQSQSFRALPIDAAPAQTRSGFYIGMALAGVGAAFFALKGIFIKLAYSANPDLDTLTLLAIRMGLAVPFYILILIWTIKRRGPDYRLPVRGVFNAGALGLIGYYLASYLDFTGLHYITAQLERLILYTYPIFVIFLGAVFFGKRISARAIVAIAISYSGLALVFARGSIASGEHLMLGAGLVAGAAFSFAVFQLLAAGQIKKTGGGVFTCIAMISAGTGILLHYIVQGGGFAQLTTQPKQVWVLGASIAIFSTLIPSFLVNIALGKIGAQAVAIVSMISPLVTIILAVTLLGEPFGPIDAAGTLLTVLGIGLFTWYERRVKQTTETTND